MPPKKEIFLDGIPKCPNHGEALLISAADANTDKGSAPCPISMCMFDFEREVTHNANMKDKWGNPIPIKTFTVTGDD